ncbi:MAG TPA: HlyD family type I secretion periplasmic adaptor subunit [Xanthobacteraceae bacterium]|jgi:hemolysin D|nr:HlyD family type I secretion periplasmic adaptor subunit [Xanthobacteraceae bacterium]
MKSIENVIPLPRGKVKPDRSDLAFLPAALEIVETPASPIGRAMAYSLIALFSIALAWAILGKVDIVAAAKGKIIPTGRTKVIQPFETGVVRAIHVRDGQVVKAGQTLIELDPTMNEAESKHYESDLMAAELDVARLQAELTDGDPAQNFVPPENASPSLVADQRKFLLDQVGEQRAKLAALDRQREQKIAERETSAATVDKLQASLPIMQERLEIRKTLYEHTTGSKANYLELLQPFVEQQHELEVQKRRSDELTAAIAAIEEQRRQAEAEYRRERYGELVEAERKAKGLNEDLTKARRRAALQVLTAPVDGTIQQLAVHTIGGVVTPAQNLLVVVPADSHLEIEAMIENRDIGFVQVGQQVEIKVDAFNFNRYGLIEGKVASVSPDAITRDKSAAKTNPSTQDGSEDESSEPANQELAFAARVTLDRTQMQVEDRMVDLSPGMAVTVEIKTGSRRIISYLLSPLLRFKQEALRER